MEYVDPQTAARVWQRVQGTGVPESEVETLARMSAMEAKDAGVYLQLSRRFRGKERTVLEQLYRKKVASASCLKGIYRLCSGKKPAAMPALPVGVNTEAALRQCYGREMQSLAAFTARTEHPEYGQVFARLADQTRQRCQMLLMLVGNMGK